LLGSRSLCSDDIAVAGDGFDIGGVGGRGFDLGPDVLDMGSDQVRVARAWGIFPHFLQQSLGGDYLSGVFHQIVEQLKLYWGKEKDVAIHA
jgi:hypothetical protein